MRQSIKEDQPALLEGKRLELIEKRANTAEANALLRIPHPTKEVLMARASLTVPDRASFGRGLKK